MGDDEDGTLARLVALRQKVIDPSIKEHNGRIVKSTGDGILAEFTSVVDAGHAAVAIQQGVREQGAVNPSHQRMVLRIGINVGDIIVSGRDIFGDGVNIAQRLESIADPGGICVSARVMEDLIGKSGLGFEDLGERELKNIARPIRAYRLVPSASQIVRPREGQAGDTFRFHGKVVDHVRRPPGISNQRGTYALWVLGNSMEPRYSDGDLVYVSPAREVKAGDYVVVQLNDTSDGEPGVAMIKRLASMTDEQLRLLQHNPHREFLIQRNRVKAVHKILTLRELLGV